MSFEWRKDEEGDWEEQVPVLVVEERPPWPYHRYVVIFAVVVVLGGIAYWQLARRATAAEANLTEQVEASVGVWQQAILEQDLELFDSLLSYGDGGWAVSQKQLLVGEQFWGRRFWGWQWQGTVDVMPLVRLSPDLTQAEVVLRQRYEVKSAEVVTTTAVLTQTAVFRLNQDRWLLATPLPSFWGEEQHIERQNLHITFPDRDRKIILELAEPLADGLQQICLRATGQLCDSQWQASVYFSTDPDTIYDGRLPREYPQMGNINLPTPTLFGLPQDEAGLHLLTQNYLSHLVPAMLPTVLGWQGERQFFYEGLGAHLLTEWGLRSSILAPSQYELLLNPPVTLQEIGLMWASSDFARTISREHVAALIEFLLARGETAVSLQHRMTLPNFWQWANLPANDSSIEQAWLQFLYDNSTSASRSLPIPLPKADIRLICDDDLYRYDGRVWQDEMEGYSGQFLVEVVPHDAGLIVRDRYYEEVAKEYRGRAFWAKGEQMIRFSEWRTNMDAPLVSAQKHDPTGRKLVLEEDDPVNQLSVRYRLLDLDDCDQESCLLRFLPGWPVWSGDGRSTLIMQSNLNNLLVPQQTQLWLGDSDGQIVAELGLGYAPFWLDEQRYGYVRLNDEGQSEVIVAYINDGAPQLLLTMAKLWEYLPELNDPLSAFVASVLVNPTNVDNLLITVATRDSDDIFLFSVGWQGDQVSKIRSLGARHGVIESVYSPDGRFILIDTLSKETGLRTLMFDTPSLDMEADDSYIREVSNVAAYAWTPDSNWLLINYPGFLKLIAPEYHYQKIIPHGFGNCGRVELITGEDNDD